ncbi:MAG: O-antigen ligase family protein [Candidatus Moranbacteria bacterium]|nr:O-antigen ligase family protein [Candidatus Moranbacteria bacterium]
MPDVKKYLIWTITIFLVVAGFILTNVLGWWPLNFWLFILLVTGVLVACFLRPEEMFWTFIALLPLENIIVSPTQIPFALRPYQLVGALLTFSILLLFWRNKLSFKLLSFKTNKIFFRLIGKSARSDLFSNGTERSYNGIDYLIFIFPLFTILATINAPDRPLSSRLSLVLFSFIVLYWLARNFFRSWRDILTALWFFVAGSLPVVLFGLYQAVAVGFDWPDFQVMDGRINATFTEPDWLGVYLVFLSAIIFWLRLAAQNFRKNIKLASWSFNWVAQTFLSFYFFFVFLCLFLTMARSAWLGFVAVFLAYYTLQIAARKFPIRNFQFRYWRILTGAGLTIMIAGLAVFLSTLLNLSNFHFFDRAISPTSGMQKITISCLRGSNVPLKIENINELAVYNCRHINLEEIENERSMGFEIKEVYRPDPNIEIRKNIYSNVLAKIKEHPIIGYGLGSSGMFLGKDEREISLNTSNLFLEVWFSAGLVGLLTFLIFFFYPLIKAVKTLFSKKAGLPEIFFIITTLGLLIPNIFNAGLMLGFFWVWLAAANSLPKEATELLR